MGEALYTLILKFKTPEAAAEAAPKLEKLLTEGRDAYEFWQDKRMGSVKPSANWDIFEKQFPLVTSLLRTDGQGIDRNEFNNSLAGRLSWTEGPSTPIKVKQTAKKLTYSATVWHFANWQSLAQFSREQLGAEYASASSDEE